MHSKTLLHFNKNSSGQRATISRLLPEMIKTQTGSNQSSIASTKIAFRKGHVEILYSPSHLHKISLFHSSLTSQVSEIVDSKFQLQSMALKLFVDFIATYPQRDFATNRNLNFRNELWSILFFDNPTPFSLKVLRHVFDLPMGHVQSYGEIARAIGHPAAARAVGTVMRKNPFPILIPCHRVVRSDGTLGEYSGYAEDGTSTQLRELSKADILKIEQEI